eukprot:6076042-Amphidinium_carterae.1
MHGKCTVICNAYPLCCARCRTGAIGICHRERRYWWQQHFDVRMMVEHRLLISQRRYLNMFDAQRRHNLGCQPRSAQNYQDQHRSSFRQGD